MKRLTCILVVLITNNLLAQNTFEKLSNKAFDFYFPKKQFDSSLNYYQHIKKQFPDRRPAYINKQIADCYLGLGDTINAEKFYLQCLAVDRNLDSLGFYQTRACYSLSDIYYHRKEFKQALNYLDYTNTKYRPLRRLCQGTHGNYEGRLTFSYKRSLCYYGLNEKENAIHELAPLIFRPRWDVYLDSVEYEEMTRFFVNTVIDVYGAAKAKDDLRKAISNLSYEPSYREDERFNLIMFSVDCFVMFADIKITLSSGNGYQVDKKGEIPEFFSKGSLVSEFADSPAYKYLMNYEAMSFITAILPKAGISGLSSFLYQCE